MQTHNLYEQLLLQQIEKDPQNLMMLPSIFWSKHHDSFKHKYFDSTFQEMNPRYFSSEQFKKHIIATPFIKLKQLGNFTKAEKWELLKESPLSLMHFDLSECSDEMINYALGLKPELLGFIDQSVQTDERVRKALAKNGLVLAFVKDEFKNYRNCKLAVSQNTYAIKHVPPELLDEVFVDLIIHSKDWVLDILPRSFAIQNVLQKHFDSLDGLRSFDSYMEIHALSDNEEVVYSFLKAVIKNNLKGRVFQNLSASFYISAGFNNSLMQYMSDHGPEIMYCFDLEQLHEIHFGNAIQSGVIFKDLPASVWKYIFPSLMKNKTNQLFYLPETLQRLVGAMSAEVLEYCLAAKQENMNLVIPNFLFNETAYSGSVDEKIIEYSTHRKVCNILVNGRTDNVLDLETIDESNTTLFEIQLLADKVDPTLIKRLFDHNPIWYPLLAIKNVETSVKFAKAFPNAFFALDAEMLKDDAFIKAIKETNPEFFDF